MNRDTWNISVNVPRVAAISERRGVFAPTAPILSITLSLVPANLDL